MDEWFYAQGREKCGPVSGTQLEDFIRNGVVTAGTLVWSKELTEWTPAVNIPRLMGQEEPPQALAGADATPDNLQLPWGQIGQTVASTEPVSEPAEILVAEVAEVSPAPTEEAPTTALTFVKKRKKPKHQRFTTKVKNAAVRVAALVLAVGILGGGSYYGAQYIGFFEDPVPARLRYLPDNPDFVFTVNVPKTMSVAQSMGANSDTVLNAAQVTAMNFDPKSIQDITIAGNVGAKSWVAVATLSKPIDIELLFPGGSTPETMRAGGEKIFFSKELSQFGMNIGFVTPSKSVLVAGPVETLKSVMKRRGAPMLAQGFQPLLEEGNSKAWMAGAADIEAFWRLADDGLPVDLDEEQRWLAQSISSVSFAFSGTTEYDVVVQARCKNPKDAPLIAKKAKELMGDRRKVLLEMLHTFGQPVDSSTKTPLDDVEIVAGHDGTLTLRQHIDKEMLEIGSEQLAAAGLAQQ